MLKVTGCRLKVTGGLERHKHKHFGWVIQQNEVLQNNPNAYAYFMLYVWTDWYLPKSLSMKHIYTLQ